MLSLTALPSLLLITFSNLVVAQISAPAECSPSLEWVCHRFVSVGSFGRLMADTKSSNTLGQTACTIAAYLMSTCNGSGEYTSLFLPALGSSQPWSAFTISALQPGSSYSGPSAVENGNLCLCNTVSYNLISACDACQGATWTRYVLSSSFPAFLFQTIVTNQLV